jgi:fucose 4-O-acetylase-like acetyltransferase
VAVNYGKAHSANVRGDCIMTSAKFTSTPTASRPRIGWMDLLRGVAIILVVIDHSAGQVRSQIPESLGLLDTFNDAVSPFRMPSLMFLSGMLLARSLEKPWRTYVAGKLGRIGWPYIVWSFVILGLLAATSSLTGGSVSASRFARIFYDPPTYLWYLAYLLTFYLICLIFRQGVIRSYLIPLALLASAFLPFELKRLVFLFAFFLLGDFVSRHRSVVDQVVMKPAVIGLCVLLGIGTAAVASTGAVVRYEATWSVGVAAMIVAVIPPLKLAANTRPGLLLSYVGRNSIVFYVTHWAVVLVVYHLAYRAGLHSPWLLFVAVFGCGLASGFIMDALRKRLAFVDALYQLPSARRNQNGVL